MVVQAVLATALAFPTGLQFGLAYGLGVRIGYEQLYPLLFPAEEEGKVTTVNETIERMSRIYDAVGGKEANQMGMASGISQAIQTVDTNPDFQLLVEREKSLLQEFGSTFSNFVATASGQTSPSVSAGSVSFDRLMGVMNNIEDQKDIRTLLKWLDSLRSGQSYTQFTEAEKKNIEQKLISQIQLLRSSQGSDLTIEEQNRIELESRTTFQPEYITEEQHLIDTNTVTKSLNGTSKTAIKTVKLNAVKTGAMPDLKAWRIQSPYIHAIFDDHKYNINRHIAELAKIRNHKYPYDKLTDESRTRKFQTYTQLIQQYTQQFNGHYGTYY